MSTPADPEINRSFARRRIAVVLVLATALGYGAFRLLHPDVASLVQNATVDFENGRYAEALHIADRALARDPDNSAALIVAGDACFALKKYDQALIYYQKVPAGPSKHAVHAQLRRGRIEMHHVGNAVAAEAHFREALRHVPEDRNALFQLATLLGIEARRNEAVPFVLRLFQQGAFNRDFLPLLKSENAALFNVKELHRYRAASPDSPAVLVGLAWHARKASNDVEALDLLKRAKDRDPGFVEARVALAGLLWDIGRTDELRTLLAESRSRDVADARFWIARGRLAERDGQNNAAIRCFWEALRRDQTNRDATYKIFRYLTESKNSETAEIFRRRTEALQTLEELDNLVASKKHADLTPIRRLVEQLESVGRLWEAWGWCRLALEMEPQANWAVERSAALRLILNKAPFTIVCRPSPSVDFDLSRLPLPKWETNSAGSPIPAASDQSAVTFRDDSKSAGLAFQYFSSPNPPKDGPRMYELNGGGCAVLDYDNDGLPDLYLTQGCRWPVDESRRDHLDRLFRNLGNGRFADVTHAAGLAENRFSAGVAVGDFDNDGFDDLYVANIGKNRMFHNNGDGTFEDVTNSAGVADPRWSTSCVIVDLNGDSLPDIYSVNYLEGQSIFDAICKHQDGRPRMCMPFHFPAAQDQLFLNLGDGRFENVTAKSGIGVPNGKGLGVVAADWEGNGRISLFVANDTVANFFFANQATQSNGIPLFREHGLSSGTALNRKGRAEACMGIAVGDADEDGDLDLFVTNYLWETNTLYRSTSPTAFDDATREAGLARPSFALLGFGTQFLDADLDGRLDLMVTNGHTDDYRPYGRPYKMQAQFFWNQGGGRFSLQPAERVGPHFSRKFLGRGLTRIDWNRDGREDAVISHLDQPVALLTNTTKRHGRYLSIRLRGVRSSRDAIGTTVVVRTADRAITRQLTAGDGYQASNERVLIFGVSDSKTIRRVEIKWPSGTKETLEGLDTNHEYLIVEGTGRALRLH